MIGNQAQQELFEQQLKICRSDLSRFERGKEPVRTFIHDGQLYPLLEEEAEFVWFCVHTGQAAYHLRFHAINSSMSRDRERRYIYSRARIFCANRDCGATVVAGLSSEKCPRCGHIDAMVLFSLRVVNRTAESGKPIELPQDFRGEGFRPISLAFLWDGIGAFVVGVVLASASAAPWLAALCPFAIVTLLVIYKKHKANTRGGIMVSMDSLSFRRLDKSPADTFALRNIGVINTEYNVIRGAFLMTMRRDFNILLYGFDGKLIYRHTNERFSPQQALEFIKLVQSTSRDVMIFSPLLAEFEAAVH